MVRCRPNCGCLVSCVRIRFVVAAASFLGFLVFLCVVLLRSPPSTILHTHSPTSRKVSVILAPSNTNWTHLLPFSLQTADVLAKEHLESEFLIVFTGHKEELLQRMQPLKSKGHHVEVVLREEGQGFTHNVLTAFDRAHFSLLLLLSDLQLPVPDTVPALVMPVVMGESDLTLLQGNDRSILLGLLSCPLTFSLSGGQNSSTLCMHKPAWMKGCGDVSPAASSLSLELLAKCHLLHSHSIVPTTSLPSSMAASNLSMLSQTLLLYWQLHPGWCLGAIVLSLLLLIRTMLRPNTHVPP